MEQQIRFCTTSDGAHSLRHRGEGPPLVRIAGWFTHLEFEWENPLWRSFNDALSRRFRSSATIAAAWASPIVKSRTSPRSASA